MEFRLCCVPPITTAQQKRLVMVAGKPRFFKAKKQAQAESVLAALLRPHIPPEPFRAPVSLEIHIVWPYVKSTPKRTLTAGVPVAHTTRPDLDNWAKGFIDLLAVLRFIEDDADIVRLALSKERGPSPGITVRLESCEAPAGGISDGADPDN